MAQPRSGLTRRKLLGDAALGVSTLALTGGGSALAASRRTAGTVALPNAAQVFADNKRMVDFGPRLTGSKAHDDYVAWLEDEFVKAGLELLPCDNYAYERWSAQTVSLDAAGPIKVSAPYTRCAETGPEGIDAPLVYGGVLPTPSISGTDLGELQAALAAYPEQLASWATALQGTPAGGPAGSILVVDLPVPAPITAGVFLPLATHLYWPGHTVADWAQIDYKRSWIMPGLGIPLTPFKNLGAKGVVFIVDSSFDALRDNYLPFDHGYEPLPAVYVDRETGIDLRNRAATRPAAKLTLTAERKQVICPSVTAVLPGTSDETLILNTHTDGQGFVEENGGVAFVHLARHFASLPAGERLKRTLVLAAWPGHMSGALPELEGWMAAHPDLVERAAGAMTIEHLGCTEWLDTPGKGYHATGENELFGVWTTQGKLFEIVRDAVERHDLERTALLRPPVQFGVGGAFQSAGIPQIGAIAGPEYLLTIRDNGDLDKLDAELAARQTAWLADIAKQMDKVSREDLRAGDPTLGSEAPTDDTKVDATPCGPDGRFNVPVGSQTVAVRFYGRRAKAKGVLLTLAAQRARLSGVTVELRRGSQVMARSKPLRVGTSAPARVVLRRARSRRFAPGHYTLVVKRKGKVLARRSVRVG